MGSNPTVCEEKLTTLCGIHDELTERGFCTMFVMSGDVF